ncbi:microsomal glutathione S-transferase 1 [Culex quinquefasciatus]|uniref:microsomal glutathione S-transferase 1 n=1 Tax=Culex quinquefasciatus TaxID=7176 RepID=UPI0018E348AC|nr:microsomal glutathione S-transferase 1 [Culex quinquefasciatus]XP_039444331.1 microsomal glutathione S-transferase 1-like [Culex pipiens pallens]
MVKLFDNINEDVYKAYVFWSTVLVVKMLLMSILTGMQRFRKKAFVNPEDIATMPKLKLKTDDPDVERVRRAHQNDLENILPYFVLAFFYILTNPVPAIAVNIFRAVAGARIMHTLVYAVVVIPQPARAIAWAIPYAASFYMAFQTLVHFL